MVAERFCQEMGEDTVVGVRGIGSGHFEDPEERSFISLSAKEVAVGLRSK